MVSKAAGIVVDPRIKPAELKRLLSRVREVTFTLVGEGEALP